MSTAEEITDAIMAAFADHIYATVVESIWGPTAETEGREDFRTAVRAIIDWETFQP